MRLKPNTTKKVIMQQNKTLIRSYLINVQMIQKCKYIQRHNILFEYSNNVLIKPDRMNDLAKSLMILPNSIWYCFEKPFNFVLRLLFIYRDVQNNVRTKPLHYSISLYTITEKIEIHTGKERYLLHLLWLILSLSLGLEATTRTQN